MSATVAHLSIYDNRLVRDVVVAHRVKTMHLDSNDDVAVLECSCGDKMRSATTDPQAALRRLWKTHAIHVSSILIGGEL